MNSPDLNQVDYYG